MNNEFVRLVNAETNEEILKYSEDFGPYASFTAADLTRTDNGWTFTAIGEPSDKELAHYVNAI